MTSGIATPQARIAEQKRTILEYFTKTPGGTYAAACKAAGVPHSTAYDWRKADPEFDRMVVAARRIADEIGGDFAESKLMEAINNSELTGIIFYLKTKHKHRGYVERVESRAVESTPTPAEDEALLDEYTKAD